MVEVLFGSHLCDRIRNESGKIYQHLFLETNHTMSHVTIWELGYDWEEMLEKPRINGLKHQY